MELVFACVVAIGMPLRAWYARRRGRAVRLDRYLVEKTLLVVVLAWMLQRNGIPPQRLGLHVVSWADFVLDLALCLLVVVGPDAWAWWRLTRARSIAVARDVTDSLLRDLDAGRHGTRSFVAAMVVGAIWEELCFRATFFLFVPRTPGGLLLGIAGGSLLFGAQHLRSGVRRASYAAGYGVIFSGLYLATENLVAVMAAHAGGNILSGLQWAPRLERRRRETPGPSIFIG